MIIGSGIDIVNIYRIEKTINKFGNRFKKRCFSSTEITKSENSFNKNSSYAKRYAAKEACSKALGTGLARGIFWKDIEVINNKYGKPYIKLHNRALKRVNKISKKNFKIEVSLSDEKKYAIATVIISEI